MKKILKIEARDWVPEGYIYFLSKKCLKIKKDKELDFLCKPARVGVIKKIKI